LNATRLSTAQILARFDDQARVHIADEPGISIIRHDATVRITGLWDCVIYSKLTEATADAAIALVEVRARAARERGYRYLTVDAADTSLPILRRMGFVPLTSVTAWMWRAEG
jgi:hypothetical protein